MSEDRDRLYERRRADRMIEDRLDRLSRRLDELEGKVDALARNVYVGLGVIGVLVLLANLVGPVVLRAWLFP
jgi:hypothetical protein